MAPNEVWVSDLTYVPTEEGWLYCAAHKDLFNGEIVGYAIGSRIATDLVEESLSRAVAARRPARGLIHHSDRGCQYCSHEYRKLVERFGMKASMSRKGNCYDNAPMESFWGTHEKRAHTSSTLQNERGSTQRHYRIHRGFLQSAAAPETAWPSIPCGIWKAVLRQAGSGMKDISCPLLTSGVIGGRAPFRAIHRKSLRPLKDSCTALRRGTAGRMRLLRLKLSKSDAGLRDRPKPAQTGRARSSLQGLLKWLSGLIRFSRVSPSAVKATRRGDNQE